VRNDLGRVCEYGSVAVDRLCAVEAHPGLYHLVSTVSGRLRPGVGWPELLAATFPPGSVTGAEVGHLHLAGGMHAPGLEPAVAAADDAGDGEHGQVQPLGQVLHPLQHAQWRADGAESS